jgi:hypothetical protein
MTAYLLEYEIINIFSSNISKIILFNNMENAYEYGKTYEPLIKREIINPLSYQTINDKFTVWESSKNIFPRYICRISPVDNDILWGFYQNNIEANKNLIQSFYKNLKINGIIS